MNGIGMYQWKNVYTTPEATADALSAMGCRWVAIKIGDGAAATWATYPGAQQAAIRAFVERGIQVWGWHYVYGGVAAVRNEDGTWRYIASGPSPEQEADFVNDIMGKLASAGMSGYIIDAEQEYKGGGQAARATRFMDRLNVSVPVALSTYRYPTAHREFPWREFYASGKIHYHMPQVYQDDGAGQAVAQLRRCIREYSEYTGIPQLPFVPAGRAYIEGPFKEVRASEITAFINECKQREFSGCFFWSLDQYRNRAGIKPEVDAGIAASPWPAPVAPPPPPEPPPPVDPLADLEQLVIGLSQDVALAWADAKLARAEAEQARQTAVKADARAVVAQEQAEAARLTIAALSAEVQTLRHRLGLYDAWRTRPLE
jgi:hypothetical protein